MTEGISSTEVTKRISSSILFMSDSKSNFHKRDRTNSVVSINKIFLIHIFFRQRGGTGTLHENTNFILLSLIEVFKSVPTVKYCLVTSGRERVKRETLKISP